MNTEQALASIGQMVMTQDPGRKLISRLPPHGPYRLLRVTRGGKAMLEGYGHTVRTSLLEPATEEDLLVDAHRKLIAVYDKSCNAVHEHFMPLAQAALAAGDRDLARRIMHRCPDHVTACFIADAIRQSDPATAL